MSVDQNETSIRNFEVLSKNYTANLTQGITVVRDRAPRRITPVNMGSMMVAVAVTMGMDNAKDRAPILKLHTTISRQSYDEPCRNNEA